MSRTLDPLAAQLLLRAYARATNMLIAGRSFATGDPTLTALLRAFGAHVGPLSDAEGTPASAIGRTWAQNARSRAASVGSSVAKECPAMSMFVARA